MGLLSHVVPPTSSMGGASTASFVPGRTNDSGLTDETVQNDLVQVTRNGCIFFVHRAQAMEQFTDRLLKLEKGHSNVTTTALLKAHADNPPFPSSHSEWETRFSNVTIATSPRCDL
jgi:hypothetical protein